MTYEILELYGGLMEHPHLQTYSMGSAEGNTPEEAIEARFKGDPLLTKHPDGHYTHWGMLLSTRLYRTGKGT